MKDNGIVYSSEKEVTLVEITPTKVFIRRDVEEIEPTEENDYFSGYSYREVTMTVSEYLKYVANGGDFKEFDYKLESVKRNRIEESKKKLEEFLEGNPLMSDCHGGKEAYYNVSLEKQALFLNRYTSFKALRDAGIEAQMMWNETGKESEVWTDSECVKFLEEMNAYVMPLVALQQSIEAQIKVCLTVEEVQSLEIRY